MGETNGLDGGVTDVLNDPSMAVADAPGTTKFMLSASSELIPTSLAATALTFSWGLGRSLGLIGLIDGK